MVHAADKADEDDDDEEEEEEETPDVRTPCWLPFVVLAARAERTLTASAASEGVALIDASDNDADEEEINDEEAVAELQVEVSESLLADPFSPAVACVANVLPIITSPEVTCLLLPGALRGGRMVPSAKMSVTSSSSY